MLKIFKWCLYFLGILQCLVLIQPVTLFFDSKALVDKCTSLISVSIGAVGVLLIATAIGRHAMKLFLLSLCGLVTVWAALTYQWFSVWQSQQSVEKWLIAQAPFGSSFKDVKNLIDQKHYPVTFNNSMPSNYDYKLNCPPPHGAHVLGADLGVHGLYPFDAGFEAFWAFDKQFKLTDLRVRVGAVHAL